MERKVRIVEATRQMHTLAPLAMPTRRKAACYLRISTRSDEQENSLENQRAHYEDLFATTPEYEFAGIYYDDGVSGTGIARRHGFQQMIADAIEGKFSLILTKSISRFGRNVVDSISTIRKLKEHGVECIFEKENIHTFDTKSSLILTIMTAMAENESMSISENVVWGLRQGFAQGKIALPYSHFLGYRKGEDGPEVVPEEADVVRTIYRRFLEGATAGSIAKDLQKAGVPTPSGGTRWHEQTITSILTNPCYKGLTIRQKTFTTDCLTHKSKKNEGELPQYVIENSHTPIIPEETWELVQLERIRRGKMGNRFSAKGPLASRLVCSDCGAFFGAKVWHSTDLYKTVIWRCNDKYKPGVSRSSGSGKCITGHVTEEEVYKAFQGIVEKLISQKPEVVAACEEVLSELMNTQSLDIRESRLRSERDRIIAQAEALNERASQTLVEDYGDQFAALEAKLSKAEEKLRDIAAERSDREYKTRQCRLFLSRICSLPPSFNQYDDARKQSLDDADDKVCCERVSSRAQDDEGAGGDADTFMALVDKVIVGDDFMFILKDGSMWTSPLRKAGYGGCEQPIDKAV